GVPVDIPLVAVAYDAGVGRSAPMELAPFAAGASERVELALRARGAVRFKVLGPDGTPAKTPSVTLYWHIARYEQEAAGDGGLLLRELAPGPVRATVGAEGLTAVEVVVGVEPGRVVERTVRLEPGAAISGIVVDESGAPVAGVRINAAWREEDQPAPPGPSHEISDSGADGRFEVVGLRKGTHKVWVNAEGLVALFYPRVDVPLS